MSAARTHFVYRMFDADGRLLYVGCTKDIVRRLRNHRSENGHFFHRIARIHQQGPYPYRSALAIERQLINTLRPDFNSLPGRRRRLREKNAWISTRTHELCGGRSPMALPISEYIELANRAVEEADRYFPGIGDSCKPHPCEVPA